MWNIAEWPDVRTVEVGGSAERLRHPVQRLQTYMKDKCSDSKLKKKFSGNYTDNNMFTENVVQFLITDPEEL